MDDSRVVKCTYGAGTLMLILSSTTTFDWVSNELRSRFKFKLGHFELRYSFTDCSNCLLESDDDLKIIFMVCGLMKDQLIHVAVRDRAVVNHVQTVNTNIIASPFWLEVVPNNDSFAQDEDTCKDSSQTGSIVDSSAASSSCLSMDFNGISSEFGNQYLGKYGSCGGRKFLSTDWEGYITHEGQKFEGGVCEFRDKLAKYLIENGFKMKYLKNESRRITVVCAKKESNGYVWHVHAVKSNVNGFFYIKNLNNVHSCSGLIREKRNKAMGSRSVSSIVKDKVRSNPLASNVGSHCVLDCGEDGSRFQRIFICFKASIDDFQWCRHMLFIDGTFVTNKYKDTLLGATGKNGNKEVFPFTFAIVFGEIVDNWRWFLQRISEVLVGEVNDVRRLPIYEMIDTIRIKMMEMISRRKLAFEKWCSVSCPVIEDELKNLAAKGRHWRTCCASESIFEVHADLSVMVNLDKRATYATLIFPIPDIEKPHPGDVFLLPPHTRKPPGLPSTKRFKSSSETKRQVKCKRCGSCDCHSMRTCKAPI
ncbi:unnamed protein product [Prunus brigantina]